MNDEEKVEVEEVNVFANSQFSTDPTLNVQLRIAAALERIATSLEDLKDKDGDIRVYAQTMEVE